MGERERERMLLHIGYKKYYTIYAVVGYASSLGMHIAICGTMIAASYLVSDENVVTLFQMRMLGFNVLVIATVG